MEHVFYNAQAGFTLQPMLLLAPIRLSDDEFTINLKWRIAARYLDILLTRRIWHYRSNDQSTMKYPIFRTMLTCRALSADDLALQLHEELTSKHEDAKFGSPYALHGMNRRHIARILGRMTSYVEEQSGFPNQYLAYTMGTGGKRFEVEHIWANKPDRHTDEFPHPSDFTAYRNRIGGLLLLPKSFNAAFGDLRYEDKLKHYFSQNLLARSLHPDCYERNPGFLQFVQRSGLPFHPYEHFTKTDLDERGALYCQLAERIWKADDLLSEVGE